MCIDSLYRMDNDFSAEEWHSCLEKSGQATVYHTLGWRSILAEVFGYKTSYAVCRNSSGDICAALPLVLVKSWITGNRVVSLPLSQYGGPLVTDPEAMKCVTDHLRGFLEKGFTYVRLKSRHRLNLTTGPDVSVSNYFTRCVITLKSHTEDEVWSSIKKKVRHDVRSAFDSGVAVELVDSAYEYDRLIEMMFQTCKKHGVPPYPPRLLKEINRTFVPKLARTFVARRDSKIIGAIILFLMNNEAIYAYSFSDSENLKYHPNHALIWTAIKWSLQNGISVFDLGTSSPLDNKLLEFKRRWGAHEIGLNDYFLTHDLSAITPDRRSSLKYRSAAFAWRVLLPQFVAGTIGPPLLRHLE